MKIGSWCAACGCGEGVKRGPPRLASTKRLDTATSRSQYQQFASVPLSSPAPRQLIERNAGRIFRNKIPPMSIRLPSTSPLARLVAVLGLLCLSLVFSGQVQAHGVPDHGPAVGRVQVTLRMSATELPGGAAVLEACPCCVAGPCCCAMTGVAGLGPALGPRPVSHGSPLHASPGGVEPSPWEPPPRPLRD
jgi:hypothetical protein